jgi:hypothetical protein
LVSEEWVCEKVGPDSPEFFAKIVLTQSGGVPPQSKTWRDSLRFTALGLRRPSGAFRSRNREHKALCLKSEFAETLFRQLVSVSAGSIFSGDTPETFS